MPKPLKFAFVAAVLLALFISAQGTAAVWRAQGNIDAGTVKTGNLHLLVGPGDQAAQSYQFEQLNGANLAPGQFLQAPLTLTNGGNTDLLYNLVGATATSQDPTAADVALANSSVLSVYAGMPASSCSNREGLTGQMLFSGRANSSSTFVAPRQLQAQGAPAEHEVLCVRLAIDSDAPQTASGGVLHLVLNFVGQQQ